MQTIRTTLFTLSLLIVGLNTFANAQYSNAYYLQELINYYRSYTGDYNTPDQQAIGLGAQLWCGHNPGVCEGALNPATYNQASNNLGNIYSDILDINHKGYMERSAIQSEGHAGYVQGAIYGESTYINPNGGNMSLPVYADPQWQYTSPDGYPLRFDYSNDTWYQSDGYGGWVQLQGF